MASAEVASPACSPAPPVMSRREPRRVAIAPATPTAMTAPSIALSGPRPGVARSGGAPWRAASLTDSPPRGGAEPLRRGGGALPAHLDALPSRLPRTVEPRETCLLRLPADTDH